MAFLLAFILKLKYWHQFFGLFLCYFISLAIFYAGFTNTTLILEFCDSDCAENWSFFNSLSRFWQLFSGCGCALLLRVDKFHYRITHFFNGRSWLVGAGYFGLFAFLIGSGLFNSVAWNTVSVVLLAATLILISGPVDGILSNPVLQYVGRTSYCLYLVHWPLIVFVNVFFPTGVPLLVNSLIIVASFGSSHLLHVFVERRFRA